MSLHEQIQKETQEALKARDEVRLSVLRGLLAAFTNELVAQKKKPIEQLPDKDALTVIKREAKKRRESIEAFEKGGREELVQKEQAELAVLETYLPETMSKEDIRTVVEKKKEELGVTDASGTGQLIGAVMKEIGDQADGGDVAAVVKEVLS